MEVSYKNTFWEILKFNYSLYLSSWVARIILGLLLFTFVDIAIDVTNNLEYRIVGKIVSFLIVVCGGFGAFLMFFAVAILIGVFSSYRMHQDKWGMCKIDARNDGLFVEAAIGKSEIRWTGITAIKKYKNSINIHISKQSAYIIPKRAFASETEFEQFYTMANEFWAKGKIEKSITE